MRQPKIQIDVKVCAIRLSEYDYMLRIRGFPQRRFGGVFRSLPPEPFADRAVTHAELCRDLPQAQALGFRDKWVFEICEAGSTLTSVRGGIQVHAHSTNVTTFARQPDTTSKVARVLELLD
jgi:hypothetical protein